MTARTLPSARCRKLLLELSRQLDGDLAPARSRQIDAHVKACECCATMAANLQRTVAACRDAGRRRVPRAVMARAAARIRALIATGDQRPRAVAPRRGARSTSLRSPRASRRS